MATGITPSEDTKSLANLVKMTKVSYALFTIGMRHFPEQGKSLERVIPVAVSPDLKKITGDDSGQLTPITLDHLYEVEGGDEESSSTSTTTTTTTTDECKSGGGSGRTNFKMKPRFKTSGTKRKIKPKMSGFKQYYEETFIPAVQEHLTKGGGWALINFEIPKGTHLEEYLEIDNDDDYKTFDVADNWTEVPIFFSYCDDQHCKVGRKMVVAGTSNVLKQSVAIGFQTMEFNEAEGYSYDALYEVALADVSKRKL